MMLVPSYQVLEFLDWLKHAGGPRLREGQAGRTALETLAREYLSRPRPIVGAVDDPLLFLLTVFQICPQIREPSVIEQMDHFARCGHCLSYVLPSRASIDTEQLHPFLRLFLEFVRTVPEYRSLARANPDYYEPRWRRDRTGEPHPEAEHYFRTLIREYGSELRSAFRQFVAEAPPRAVEQFERFRMRQNSGERSGDFERGRVGIEDGTIPITDNERPDDAARRLAESVEQLLNGGFYDLAIANQPKLFRLMQLMSDRYENLGQSLEFFDWIHKNHPNVDVAGDIPSEKSTELVQAFCEERGYSNGASFSKQVAQWLRGEGDAHLLRRIWNFVVRTNGARHSYNHRTPPFTRYQSVPVHGLFLFLSSGDFPAFIEDHWEDLNQLTGNYLDVYYSKADLKRRVSGYETMEQFKTLEIKADELPALVLWQASLADAHVVPLGRLDHVDVVEVVKQIVQGIREKRNLTEIASGTCDWVEDRVQQVRSLEGGGYVRNKFVISGGENVQVFNEPRERVIAVAATRGASVSGNVFDMGDDSDLVLTEDDVRKLRDVVSRLEAVAQQGDIPRSVASDGTAHVWRIVEAREGGSPEQTKAAISKWREWFGSLDAKALKVIASIADAVSLGLPLAKALGFQVP